MRKSGDLNPKLHRPKRSRDFLRNDNQLIYNYPEEVRDQSQTNGKTKNSDENVSPKGPSANKHSIRCMCTFIHSMLIYLHNKEVRVEL